jgi:hypothetical protein
MHLPNLAVVLDEFKGDKAGPTQFQVSLTSELPFYQMISKRNTRVMWASGFLIESHGAEALSLQYPIDLSSGCKLKSVLWTRLIQKRYHY